MGVFHMKKGIIIVIIVGMFSWAVYDFISKSDKTTLPNAGVDLYSGDKDNNDTEEKQDVVGLNAGNIAPDFELETLFGEVVKLSDYRGQRVLLNFWATWCAPCRAEMPDMQKFHENKDVVILAVNLTDTESKASNVPRFVDDFELTFPILLDEDVKVSGLYQIQPIPTSFLIDSTGRIHNVAYGALNYDQMVQEFEKMN